MKVGSKIVILFDGFTSSIADALSSSSSHRRDDSFELPLNNYGIDEFKARGKLIHFVDNAGNFEVSVLVLEKYEPPILACAVNELLSHLRGASAFGSPTIIVPFVGSSSKLKWGSKIFTKDSGEKASMYRLCLGPETDITRAIASRTEELPSSVQIHYEPVACLIHLIRVLNLPASVLIGERQQNISDKNELQLLYEIGELVADAIGLSTVREKFRWNPVKTPKNVEEPWRQLYG